MATILEFISIPRPASVPAVIADGTAYSAEIVLFPGVRYERHAEPETKSEKPARAKRRRDTLELEV
jgi:hypothetical protein